jgi:HPr kinase/phosphorylase
MAAGAATVHASAVLVGSRAVLIRGAAGAGKSRLALALIQSAATGALAFARLVADDRVELTAGHGRLIARAPLGLVGLIEVRGLGIRRIDFEPVALVGWVVDLGAADAVRLPDPAVREALISGVKLPRLPLGAEADSLSALLAMLRSADAGV